MNGQSTLGAGAIDPFLPVGITQGVGDICLGFDQEDTAVAGWAGELLSETVFRYLKLLIAVRTFKLEIGHDPSPSKFNIEKQNG
jgi:hypothetical protein